MSDPKSFCGFRQDHSVRLLQLHRNCDTNKAITLTTVSESCKLFAVFALISRGIAIGILRLKVDQSLNNINGVGPDISIDDSSSDFSPNPALPAFHILTVYCKSLPFFKWFTDVFPLS